MATVATSVKAKLNKRSEVINTLVVAAQDDLEIDEELKSLKDELAKRLKNLVNDC